MVVVTVVVINYKIFKLKNMEIKKDQKIIINCLEGKPHGKIIEAGESTSIIEMSDKLLEVENKDILEGPNGTLIAVDFTKELTNTSQQIRHGNMPDHEVRSANMIAKMISDKMDKNGPPENLDEEIYTKFITTSINSEGNIYPSPVMILNAAHMGIAALGLSKQKELTEAIRAIIADQRPEQIMFGFDRINKGHGVDAKYKSLFTIFYKSGDNWKYGVLGYNSQEDNSGKIDWDNKYWVEKMQVEMKRDGFIKVANVKKNVSTGKNIGTALQKKITIFDYYETEENGFFYEGIINPEMVSKDVISFLKKKKLDINKIEDVLKMLQGMGYDFKFSQNEKGFYDLNIASLKISLTERRSKTRIYLEALELLGSTGKLKIEKKKIKDITA